MLAPPLPNRFQSVETNIGGQVGNSTWGTSITPGNNTFPAYVEVLPNTAIDTYFLEIGLFAFRASTLAKNTLVTIGIDHAGGTTYTNQEILHLLASDAAAPSYGGVWYRFPLFIPAGSALAAKASVNNATVGTGYVGVRLWGRPTHPENMCYGTYIDSWGAATGTSSGTSVTPGTASEGAWAEMTTGVTTRPYWWWQCGWGSNDASLINNAYTLDVGVGDASTKDVAITDELHGNSGTVEEHGKVPLPDHRYVYETASGIRVYGRMQCNASDASITMMAYGLGG
jgi:hypothetical protein